jgi:hypothetical protein
VGLNHERKLNCSHGKWDRDSAGGSIETNEYSVQLKMQLLKIPSGGLEDKPNVNPFTLVFCLTKSGYRCCRIFGPYPCR